MCLMRALLVCTTSISTIAKHTPIFLLGTVAAFANNSTGRIYIYTLLHHKTVRLRQHWDAMKIQVAEKDLLAAQTNQVLSPKIKRYQMCLALRAMASEHSIAIAEERKLLQTELEQGIQLTWLSLTKVSS